MRIAKMSEFMRKIGLALMIATCLGVLYMLGVFFSSGLWNPLQWCLFGKIIVAAFVIRAFAFLLEEI